MDKLEISKPILSEHCPVCGEPTRLALQLGATRYDLQIGCKCQSADWGYKEFEERQRKLKIEQIIDRWAIPTSMTFANFDKKHLNAYPMFLTVKSYFEEFAEVSPTEGLLIIGDTALPNHLLYAGVQYLLCEKNIPAIAVHSTNLQRLISSRGEDCEILYKVPCLCLIDVFTATSGLDYWATNSQKLILDILSYRLGKQLPTCATTDEKITTLRGNSKKIAYLLKAQAKIINYGG